jgi:hypothetical protein
MKRLLIAAGVLAIGSAMSGCSGDDDDDGGATADGGTGGGGSDASVGKDPDTAPLAEIDRFSEKAGMLMVRDAENGLPGPDEPIDFDQAPFVTQGFGPAGQVVRYYNFDVKPTKPAPIYAFFRESSGQAVDGQLNIVGVIPGDSGYNDFWQVVKVNVPDSYVANSMTSADEVTSSDFDLETTKILVNCPIVPDRSTAAQRLEGTDTALSRGWYKGTIVRYFNFNEKADFMVDGSGNVATADIFVSFNVNPPEGGPPSGFKTEEGSEQTHNVVTAVPEDAGYSPLWRVDVYDNADFDDVMNLESAQQATLLAEGAALVNCPIVAAEE